MTARTTLSVSAIMGFLAVALGAFGAHALKPTLLANAQLENWNTAAHYHLVHAVAMLAIALHAPQRVWTSKFWLLGIVIFSGSLYFLAALNLKVLGAITPIGGLFLLAGWGSLLVTPKHPAQP